MNFELLNRVALTVGDNAGSSTTTGGGTTNAGGLLGGFGNSPWMLLIWIAVFGLIFYFLLIRPQKKKDKEKQNMLEAMKKGDKITTIGGISGKIASIKDNTIILEVASIGGAEKVKIEIQRWAVGSVDKSSDEVELTTDDASAE